MRSPTIKEVASKCGVGVGTVSRVLNNSPQISETTRKKVLSVIKELNYVPNVNGRRLSQKCSHVIAVVVPVISHPYFASLISELELEADEKGYALLVASSQHRIEKEQDILKRLAQNEADGAIFVTHNEHDEKDFKNLALVSIDRHLGKDIPIVTSNNYDATRQGVSYLIEKGCKNIAFLGTKPSQASEVSFREQAYLDVMKENNLDPYVLNKIIPHGKEKDLINELFSSGKKFDGIFVSGCTLAAILYNTVKDMGIKVPSELQIVSYDGEFSNDNHHHITTLEQPLKDMAKCCIKTLIELINENKQIQKINKFDCRFVKGETTK